MTDFQNLIQQLPTQIYLIVGVAFIIGFIIWSFGNRLLRPMMLLIGVVAGSAIGFLVTGYLPESIPFFIPVIGGALLFGLVALAVYRMAMPMTLALCLAVACPLGYYTYTEITGTYEGQPGEPLTASDLHLPMTTSDSKGISGSDISTEDLQKATDTAKQVVQEFIAGEDSQENGDKTAIIPESWRNSMRETISFVSTTTKNHWHDAPAAQKLGIVATALAGLIGGFFAGVLLPSLSAAVVTTLSGSLIMLISGFWLATRFSLPFVDSVRPQSATAALSWWLLLSVVGLFVQMTAKRRKKHRHLIVNED